MQRRGDGDAKPSEELKNFTDREDEQALFRALVDAPSGSPLPMVMFYGVGGTGKTASGWRTSAGRSPASKPPSGFAPRPNYRMIML